MGAAVVVGNAITAGAGVAANCPVVAYTAESSSVATSLVTSDCASAV